jgi:tRNA-2-methylthio-N6-dimethylallyladenosine synthase
LDPKVSEDLKQTRLRHLLELQGQISLRKNKALVGTVQEILVDGLSKKKIELSGDDGPDQIQWTGRTKTNKIVNFSRNRDAAFKINDFTGLLIQVEIKRAFPHSLWGRPVPDEPAVLNMKGEHSFAA